MLLTLRSVLGMTLAYVAAVVVSGHLHPHDVVGRLILGVGVFVVVGFAAAYVFAGRPAMLAGRAQRERLRVQQAALTAQADQHEFIARVQTGLDMAETEADAHLLVGQVLARVTSGPAELLLADSSRAHLARVAVSSGQHPRMLGPDAVPVPRRPPRAHRPVRVECRDRRLPPARRTRTGAVSGVHPGDDPRLADGGPPHHRTGRCAPGG
jgi:hypothetical protein